MQAKLSLSLLSFGLCLAKVATAGWVSPPTSGAPYLTCNPKTILAPQPISCVNNPGNAPPFGNQIPVKTQSTTNAACKVSSSDLNGFILKLSRSAPILGNSVTVGTLYDQLYCKGAGTSCDTSNTYILRMRVALNTAGWMQGNPFPFEANNIRRAVKSTVPALAGYDMSSGAKKYLEYVGRTTKGISQIVPPGTAADLNLGWMNFWVDSDANDPQTCELYNYSSPSSPWLYVRQVCSAGYNATPQSLKIGLWEGGESGQPLKLILTSGYVCN